MAEDLILTAKCPEFFPDPKEETAVAYVLRRCDDNSKIWKHPCIQDPVNGGKLEYADINILSLRVASYLRQTGFKFGDILINASHNGPYLHVFFLGVWRIGGIVQCLYPEDVSTLLAKEIRKNEVKYILCDVKDSAACLEAAGSCGEEIKILAFGEATNCISVFDIFATVKITVRPSEVLKVRSDDIALLLPTSGTTGQSKSVVYTHDVLLKNILVFENFPFTNDPVAPTLITGRQTHLTGSVCPLGFFTAGRFVLMLSDVTQTNILFSIENYRVRAIFSFPSFLTGLVTHGQEYDLSSLQFVFTAGMVLGTSFFNTIKQIPTVKRIVTIYGMTEVGFLTANAYWTPSFRKITCTLGHDIINGGKLLAGSAVMVKDLEKMEWVGAGKTGELFFRSPLVCPGYWKNVAASQATFHEGWIATGDLGYFDTQGNVYVLNRLKDVFKYFNNHITPNELEQVLLEHPEVVDSCVVGVSDPDGGGSVPRAFIKVASKQNYAKVAEDVLQFYNDKVGDYKKLRGGLFVVEEFPQGKSGKILREALSSFSNNNDSEHVPLLYCVPRSE